MEQLRQKALELLKGMFPEKPETELLQVINFGFWLAATPKDFIEVLEEQSKK